MRALDAVDAVYAVLEALPLHRRQHTTPLCTGCYAKLHAGAANARVNKGLLTQEGDSVFIGLRADYEHRACTHVCTILHSYLPGVSGHLAKKKQANVSGDFWEVAVQRPTA